MRLSPIDIRNQQFSRSFRGFNPDAVDSFRNLLANELEELIRQNSDYAARLKRLEERLESYVKIERSINETLVLAQKTADEVRQNAQREAELIVREAGLRAGHEEAAFREKIMKIDAEYAALRSQRDAFFARFKGLLTTQLGLLPALGGDVEPIDESDAAPSAPRTDEPVIVPPVVEELSDPER